METIERFLDVMAFASNADRTNTVAAALTVKLRDHWPGQKPVILVTSTKSHSGKGTITDFFRGILFDNVRCDSAGRSHFIRSSFIESFVTSAEVTLASPSAGEAIHLDNRYVVTINTNQGQLSPDLMNRGITIHLAPRGV